VIVNGNPVHRIKPGEIIGEMIVWFGGLRQATLKASMLYSLKACTALLRVYDS
jgi:hypothetical protein